MVCLRKFTNPEVVSLNPPALWLNDLPTLWTLWTHAPPIMWTHVLRPHEMNRPFSLRMTSMLTLILHACMYA